MIKAFEQIKITLKPVSWELKDNEMTAVLMPNSMKDNVICSLMSSQHGRCDVKGSLSLGTVSYLSN